MLISVHIPKTAGSTYQKHLRSIFGKNICYDFTDQYDFVDPASPTMLMRILRMLHAAKRGRASIRDTDECITGHFRASKYYALYPDAKLVTWVRDPVERVISHYYHWLRHPTRRHSVCHRLHKENLSLVQFAEIPEMRNLQFRYLDGINVEEFWFVGVQEYFDEMMPLFYKQMRLPNQFFPAENVNKKNASDKYSIDMETKKYIRELNSKDQELYLFALNKYKGLREELGGF